MNVKTTIAAIVVIVVIVAVAIVLYDGDEDNSGTSPSLRTDLEVGDYITTYMESSFMGQHDVDNTTYTITSIDATTGELTVSENTNGTTTTIHISQSQFLDYLRFSSILAGFSVTGTEVIETNFGSITCDVWEGRHNSIPTKFWICPDNGVAFRGEGSTSVFQTSFSYTLVGTSLLS